MSTATLTADQIASILADTESRYRFTNPALIMPLKGSISDIEKTFGSRKFLIAALQGQTCWTVYQNDSLLVAGLSPDKLLNS
jgi:hypothetical protein